MTIRLMIVDDQDPIRRSIRREMTKVRELAVEDFSLPDAALKRHDDEPFAIAILDIAMPGIDGVTLAQRLRERTPGIIVIFVTSEDDGPRVDAARSLATAVFLKPWDSDALRSCVLRARAAIGSR